jgi:hypothetical protein
MINSSTENFSMFYCLFSVDFPDIFFILKIITIVLLNDQTKVKKMFITSFVNTKIKHFIKYKIVEAAGNNY